MNDQSGFELLGNTYESFHLTFVRGVQEQEVLRRLGGNPALAWPLPLGAYDKLDELLYEIENDVLDEAFVRKRDDQINSVVQIGTCPGWVFAIEAYEPWSHVESFVGELSVGTTAVCVGRNGAKWLRLIDWAEDGEWKGGGEASGPYMPPLQALMEQAGVDEASDLGKTLFAPLLSSVWGIHLPREALEKPLLTGPFLFPPAQEP